MKATLFLALVAVLLAAQVRPSAGVQSQTVPFDVSLTVSGPPSTATIATLPLNFGASTTSAGSGQGGVVVLASQGLQYSIALDGGTHPPTNGYRTMFSQTADIIPYTLTTDAAHTLLWGNGTSYGNTVPGVGSGTYQSYVVYGQTVSGPAGTGGQGLYTDIVTATVNF